jgi:hypothetical protein
MREVVCRGRAGFISGDLFLPRMASSGHSWMAATLIALICTAPAFGQLDGAKLERSPGLERTKLQSGGTLK